MSLHLLRSRFFIHSPLSSVASIRAISSRVVLPPTLHSSVPFRNITFGPPLKMSASESAPRPPPAPAVPHRPSHAGSGSPTEQYALSHTMIRIKDPKPSLHFYVEVLGMTLCHVMHSEGGKFTNYFLLYPQSPIPENEEERRKWMWTQQGIIELCHNWGTESDPNFQGYKSGNEPGHKGFGHLCVLVDDLQRSCDRFTELGVKFKKRPEEGSMRHIAFLLDPDNYWIEIVQKGGFKS